MLRPAGVLVPERKAEGLAAGFGQIEAQVLKVGMIGEVTCVAKPWTIIPMVVTEVQNVISTGQVRATDTLLDVTQLPEPGRIMVAMEPLYAGQLNDLPRGGSCIANTYTNNHEALADPNTGTLRRCWAARHRRRRCGARDDPAHPGPAATDPDPGVRRALTGPGDGVARPPVSSPAGAAERHR